MINILSTLTSLILGIIIGLLLPDLRRRLQKPVILRTIPHEEAKELILSYLEDNDQAWTSEIIFDLALSTDLVLSVLDELQQEGKIEPRIITSKEAESQLKR